MDIQNGVNNVTKTTTLVVATITSFLIPLMASAVNVALPSIGKEFNLDAITLSWIETSYLLAAATFLVPFGRFADIHGRKKVFSTGMIIFTIASFLCAISNSSLLLICARLLLGIGGAMIFGTSIAIITSVFAPGEKGKALGINVAAVYLGLSLGPLFGGFLTEHYGWRSLFFSNVTLSLFVIVLTFWKLKGEWIGAKGEPFDLIGSIIYSISIILITYGITKLPTVKSYWFIPSGITCLIIFVIWELKIDSPVLNINLFKNNTLFAFSNLATLIHYCSTSAVSFLLSIYLQYIKSESPEKAGLVLVSQSLIMAIFSPLAGRLSDRIESRIVASIGMGITLVGLIQFIFLNENTSFVFIIIDLIIIGFGFAFFSSPNTNAVMSSVDKQFYGVASATVGTMRLLGNVLSMGLATMIFEIYIGDVKITPACYPELIKSIKTAFTIFTVICFFGVFASIARGKTGINSKK
jgi:EmrB/QacA subfamily drug resistance transporter